MLRRTATGILLLAVFLGMVSCYVPPPPGPPGPPPPAVATPPAQVTPPPPAPTRANIPAQITNQQSRINQGVRSGQLTRREAAILQDNLNWIRAEHSRLSARGRLTPAELNMLERRLQQNDQMIFNKKNNPIRRIY